MRALFLAPLSLLYRLGVAFRHRLFDWGMLKQQEYDIPIVVIGNLTVGGTGKTPVAEYLAEYLSRNYNVALLSRGYKRRTSGYLEVTTESSFRDVGDEPKQIKLKFPDMVVAVCADRRKGIAEIRRLHPEVNLILLDDGFQHRYVEPWVNILLMDYTRPIYRDRMLPWGNLRDSLSQLHRAHCLLVTKCPPDLSPLDERLVKKYLSLYAYQAIFFSRMEQGRITPLFPETERRTIEKGSNIIVMAGIGNPGALVSSLEKDYKIVDTLIFKDHHPYRMRDLEKMKTALKKAPGGTIIVTTEKDAVKFTNRMPREISDRLYYIPINVSFAGDSESEFLRKLDQNVRANPKHGLLHSQ